MSLIYKTRKFPSTFNDCKIKPIIKDYGKSRKDINNIRPITISNSLAQLFERLILNKNYNNLRTNKNQFGFKRNSSCKLALFMRNNIKIHREQFDMLFDFIRRRKGI